MPFDGRNAILASRPTLAAAMLVSRIEPIDSQMLDRHNADELRRYPAGCFIDTELLCRSPRSCCCWPVHLARSP
jgi:hypothetical protein